ETDRAEQRADDVAVTAAADSDELGAMRRLDQRSRRSAVGGDHLDTDIGILVAPRRQVSLQVLMRLAFDLGPKVLQRSDLRGPRGTGHGVGRERDERAPAAGGGRERDAERLGRGGRAIDPDDHRTLVEIGVAAYDN